MNKKKNEDYFLLTAGIIFFILGITAFYNSFRYSDTADIFWFSYTAFFLIGLGMIIRSSYLIASQLDIVFIPYIIWNVDFLYVLITQKSLTGITDYFFVDRLFLLQVITLQHLFIIPIAFIAIYFIKLKRKDFFILSLIQITIFFFIIKILKNPEENVNCVFKNCLSFSFPFIPYSIAWFIIYMSMIFITNFLLVKLFFRK